MKSRSKWITEPEPCQTATVQGVVFSVGIMADADAEAKWTFIEEAKTKMKETKTKKKTVTKQET